MRTIGDVYAAYEAAADQAFIAKWAYQEQVQAGPDIEDMVRPLHWLRDVWYMRADLADKLGDDYEAELTRPAITQ